MSRTAARFAGIRVPLLAAMVLLALLLSVIAMHASMVRMHDAAAHPHAAAVEVMPMVATATQVDAGPSSDHGMGGMGLVDCLILGMVCFLAAALLVLALLTLRLRSILRLREGAQSLSQALRRFRPPAPPSLLQLSISRI